MSEPPAATVTTMRASPLSRLEPDKKLQATRRLSAAVVGAGLMGRWHALAAQHAGASVVGIVDPDPHRAASLARQLRLAHPAASLEELLRNNSIDVIHVCTPSGSHFASALTALDAGCHVLVEKPFAEDLVSAKRLVDAATMHGRIVCPVHQFLFQRGALAAKAHLRALGPLRHIEMEICSAGAQSTPESREAVAIEILPHPLAFAAWLCDTPITAGDWDCRQVTAGELTVFASVGDVGFSARISMRGRPPANRLRLVAERGTLHLDLFHGFSIVERSGVSKVAKLVRPFLFAAKICVAASGNLLARSLHAEMAYPGLRELVRRFYRAASGHGPNPIPTDEMLAVMAVWDSLRHQLQFSAVPGYGGPERPALEAT